MRDAVGRLQTVLVLGAGSDIAAATLRELARDGRFTAVLCARRPETLDTAELESSGVEVERLPFDALAVESHEGLVGDVFERHGDVDLVLLAFGVLGEQAQAERDGAAASVVVQTNFVGAVSTLTPVVERLRAQGHGAIVVLSSVAAMRARRSNFVYGASKAGLDAFAQGLQLALQGTGVHLMIVRPGFVKSKMTRGLAPLPLSVETERVAAAIVSGLRREDSVVWVPPAMRVVAWILRFLPRQVMARL